MLKRRGFARSVRALALAGAACLAGPILASPAAAQNAEGVSLSQTEETLFRADEIVNHGDLGVTVLRGGVEIAQAGYVLTAETVSYNREADVLSASGDVVLMHPDGTVMFSTYMEITSDGFKNGVIENIRILLQDDARIAANGARRSDGNRTELAKAVYSPCAVCRDDPTKDPLWQVKARRITHDEDRFLLQYEDAWLEVFGVPILYTPYFQHYDPRVERKSGVLAPSFGSTAGLGQFFQPRYFWVIDESKDITVEPVLGSSGDVIAAAEYRQRLSRGEIEADFSLGELDPVTGSEAENEAVPGEDEISDREVRGHIRLDARYHLDETWRAGLDLNRTTDKSYNRAYPLFGLPETQLVSKANVEGFRTRNYATAEMLSIQSLRIDKPEGYREQDVIPRLLYSGRGEADRFGGRWQFDTEARMISVENDDDTHRLTVMPGYGFNKASSLGFRTDFLATAQANAYVVERDASRLPDEKSYEVESFVLPKASMEVSYPFVRYGAETTQTVSPLLFGAIAPNTTPPSSVSFEDTTRFELEEHNIFAHKRLNGLDAAEGGSRAAAGARYRLDWTNGIGLNATLGRLIDRSVNDELSERTGLGLNARDWVGALSLELADYGSVDYRFRSGDLLHENVRRQELDWSVGPQVFSVSGNYTFVEDQGNGLVSGDSEFMSLGVASRIDEQWSAVAAFNRDIEAAATRSVNGRLQWENECTIVSANLSRSYTEVNGRGQQNDTLFVNFTLKTLGEYGLDIDPTTD
ncbi:MAG: LPS assembly protein LptD [Marivibrio sp.]|uniref:LPS-assembly protein LptD n=1 Tax=Marivibrio sp. TaxID=2039719 RepID=UPI0032EB85FA